MNARRAGIALAIVAGLIGTYGLVDKIEQDTEARIALASAYRESCLPKPGEKTVVISDGRTAHCRTYQARSLERGFAPKLVSSASVEVSP